MKRKKKKAKKPTRGKVAVAKKRQRTPKKKRPARQEAINAGYRSGFELSVARDLEVKKVDFCYEEDVFEYTIDFKYNPDFKIGDSIFVEAKGNFTSSDRRKMRAVKECNPDLDIRMLFMRDNRLNKTSKTTYSMWATRHGFPWAIGKVPDAWIKEAKTKKR